MRLPDRAQLRSALRQRAEPPKIHVIPAPSGGLNGRDAWSEMPETDAIRLDNYLPGFGKVTVRPGSVEYVDLETDDPVETLATLDSTSGLKFFAASGGSLWNITDFEYPDEEYGSGAFTNDRWQTANMNDMIAFVNGADLPMKHDGVEFSELTITGMNAAPIGVNVFKSRSYFWEDGSQDFYYSAVNTLGGAVSSFPLGDVGSFGGELTTMITWTQDGGAGMDDLAVFLMSSGEAIVYSGSDPNSSTDWSLVGVFRMGSPLGRRCAIKLGGDALVLTVDGPVLLSKVLPGGRTASGLKISDKLGNLLPEQAQMTGDDFGWLPLFYPLGQLGLINYPVAGGGFEQFVVNLRTGAWSRFKGWEANSWALFGDVPHFGTTDGRVVQAFNGATDEGANIVADARQAFSYLGTQRASKHVTMVSPLIETAADVATVSVGLAADFNPDPQSTVQARLSVGSAGAFWNEGDWDAFDWAGPNAVQAPWFAHQARGYAVSPSLKIEQSVDAIAWHATRVAYRRSGLI